MNLSRKQAQTMGLTDPIEHQERSVWQQWFTACCAKHDLPIPMYEYPFGKELDPPRRYRADILFGDWLIVEKVGGVFIQGRHSRGQSQIDDMERRNLAQIAGYVVLEFPPSQFNDGTVFEVIKRALKEMHAHCCAKCHLCWCPDCGWWAYR